MLSQYFYSAIIYDHLGSTSGSITMLSLVLACAITALTVFPLGLLVGVVFCWCSKRQSCDSCDILKNKQSPVVPKSIELEDNPAYGPIHQIRH